MRTMIVVVAVVLGLVAPAMAQATRPATGPASAPAAKPTPVAVLLRQLPRDARPVKKEWSQAAQVRARAWLAEKLDGKPFDEVMKVKATRAERVGGKLVTVVELDEQSAVMIDGVKIGVDFGWSYHDKQTQNAREFSFAGDDVLSRAAERWKPGASARMTGKIKAVEHDGWNTLGASRGEDYAGVMTIYVADAALASGPAFKAEPPLPSTRPAAKD